MYAHNESSVHSRTHRSFSPPTLNAPSSTRIQSPESVVRDPFVEQDDQHLHTTSILPREKLHHLLHPFGVSDVKNYIGSNRLASAYQGFEIGCSTVQTKMVANTTIPTVRTQTLSTSFFRDAVPGSNHSLAESSTHKLSRRSIETVLSTRCSAIMRSSGSNYENSTQFYAEKAISNPLSSENPRLPSFATINPSIYEKINRRSPYHLSHSQPLAIEGSVHSLNHAHNGSNHMVKSYNTCAKFKKLPAIDLLLPPLSIPNRYVTKSVHFSSYDAIDYPAELPDSRDHSQLSEDRTHDTLRGSEYEDYNQNIQGDTANEIEIEAEVQKTKKGYKKRNCKRCIVQNCARNAVTRGLCISHGGGRRCQESGCSRGAQNQGLCVAHGGGRVCRVKGCTNIQRSMGLCIRHGGGRRCCMPGCSKGVVRQNLCTAHGGKKKCKVEYCLKLVKKKGFCRSHANELKL